MVIGVGGGGGGGLPCASYGRMQRRQLRIGVQRHEMRPCVTLVDAMLRFGKTPSNEGFLYQLHCLGNDPATILIGALLTLFATGARVMEHASD